MSFIELFLLAIGLSMDAFAVSICEGLSMKKLDLKKAGILALFFGGFQAGMPLPKGHIQAIMMCTVTLTTLDNVFVFYFNLLPRPLWVVWIAPVSI